MALTKINLRALFVWVAVLLLTGGMVWLPVARAQQTDHAKKLGMKLMCICGCAQVLVQCNHIGCPSSVPMLKELDSHIAAAESDDLVIQDFIQEYGVQVLSSPPNQGFNRVAFLLPGIAFALGLALITVVIAHWRRRVPLAATAHQVSQSTVSPEMLARARAQVHRETED